MVGKWLLSFALLSMPLMAQAGDRLLGEYSFTFMIGESEYTDVFSISNKNEDGTYFGESAYGSPVIAIKQGSQFCASSIDSFYIGQSWCAPIGKKSSNFAFYIGAVVMETVPINKMGTLIVKASVKKSTLKPVNRNNIKAQVDKNVVLVKKREELANILSKGGNHTN